MDDEDIHKPQPLKPTSTFANDNAGVRIMPPVIYLGFFILSFILELFLGSNLLTWGAQFSLGILLISFGTGLLTWCIILLIDEGTNIPPNQPTTALVKKGPYNFSRNPIYIALSAMFLGSVILFDMICGLFLFIPLLYVIQKYVVEKEEKYLLDKFGTEYKEYCDTVRRWL